MVFTSKFHGYLQGRNFSGVPLILLLASLLSINPAYAQTARSAITIHSEENQVIDATTAPATQYLNGNVRIFHEGTFMYCDTAILQGSQLRMYHNVVMMQNDTIRIFADSVYYNGDSLVAYVYGNLTLQNGATRKLYSNFLRYDAQNKIGYSPGDTRLVDGSSSLVSRRGKYALNEKKAWFYKQVQVIGEDFTMATDSLAYQTTTQIATFLAPVRIDKDTSRLYAEQGWFDLDDKQGDFIQNAAFQEGATIARADTIHYDGKKDLIILHSDTTLSTYFTKQDTAFAKSIYYDRGKEIYILAGQASYQSPDNAVKGDKVTYEKMTGEMHVSGRSQVSDPPFLIDADTLDYNKSSKFGKADGKVIWRDTSAKTAIIADHVLYRGESKYMKAHNDAGRPLFITEMDTDTMFLRADTLRAFRRIVAVKVNTGNERTQQNELAETAGISDTLNRTDSLLLNSSPLADVMPEGKDSVRMDTLDFFTGEGKVRIFKSDMQAICDTLLFHQRDSVFLLRGMPIVWSDSTQIAGDTIDLRMKKQKIDKVIVRSQATVVSTEDDLFYDQITGRQIEAAFLEGKLSRMDVSGNAQLVYYLRDDEKAYIGVNTTEASSMTFYLEDNKGKEIRNFNKPQSKVLPMEKTDHEALRVKGFQWSPEKRPDSSSSL